MIVNGNKDTGCSSTAKSSPSISCDTSMLVFVRVGKMLWSLFQLVTKVEIKLVELFFNP